MNLKRVYLAAFLLVAIACQSIPNSSISVKNMSELQEAIENAKPGHEIVLKDGIWKDVKMELKLSGTKNAPIIVRAENAGKVFIEGESYLTFGGDYITVEGLYFRNGYSPINAVIQFRSDREKVANNCKVVNCVIEDFNQPQRDRPDHWVEFWGRHNVLENCYIAGKSNQGPTIRVNISGRESIKNYHKIINNHFGPRPRKGGPRGETIQLGDSYTSMSPSNTIVANNYFERCNGEVEVISSKTNYNQFKNNVFYKCEGSLVMRHGNYCTIDGNYFIGDENSTNIGGIRIINTGHKVVNNYFFNLKGKEFRSPLAVMNGIPKSPLNRYNQVTDLVVAFNTWVNCESPLQFGVGTNISQSDVLPKSEIRSARPIRTVVANNLIYNEKSDDNIVVAHDKVDGVKFKNNYLNNGEDQTADLKGFEMKSIEMKTEKEFFYYPRAGLENAELYDGFEFDLIETDLLGNARSKNNVAGAIVGSTKKISKIFDLNNYGPDWFPIEDSENIAKSIIVKNDKFDFNSIIETSQNGDTLLLERGVYNVPESIRLNKNIVIKSLNEKPTLNYTGKNGSPLFEMNPKGDLVLENLELKGNNRQYAFATLTKNMCSLYNLSIDNCIISDFEYVLKAYKESFADEIKLANTKISNCENGIELSEEKNDKGDYNVEFLIVDNCEFDNIKKNVIDYYRGGYDESTIGGNLIVANSTFSNSGEEEENKILLNTRGIINVDISNNKFLDNPVKLVALLWGAKNNSHSNNEINNSGKIIVEENLKLKLMY